MAKWAFNPDCKCKKCTGQGLGWIKHLSKAQAKIRHLREQREHSYLDDCASMGVQPDMYKFY